MALSLGKLPWWGHLALFLAISLLFVGVFYWYFYGEMSQKIETLRSELDSLQADLEKGHVMEAKRPEFLQEIERLNLKLETLKRILPERQEVDDILRKLQGLAAESNLNILAFTPGTEARKEFYIEWPIVIQISGTYHNLAMFFDKIGKFSRIFNISNLDIAAVSNPRLEVLTITSSCTASTFIYVEAAPPRPAAAAPVPRPPRQPKPETSGGGRDEF